MEPRIGMISSSLKLAELTRRVANKFRVEMVIQIGTLERAVASGKALEAQGIEVIISRGGTAAILRDKLSIPVLSIPMSAFDLLESILEATKYGKKIGITVYGNPISGLEILERHFQIHLKQIIYSDSENLRIGIRQAHNDGIEALIGGNFSFEVSQEMGLPCVLISSSEETIARMIEEARVVASIRREEKEKTQRMEAILNLVSEGIVAIDKAGMVTLFNKVAGDILGIRGSEDSSIAMVVTQLGLSEVLTTGRPKLQRLQQVGEIQIVNNIMPVHLGDNIIGAIASFLDVPKVIRTEQKVRKSYAKGFVAKYTLDNIVGKSRAMRHVIEEVKQFAPSDSTVLITGESGTGKELVAHSIHNLSARREEPFISINCSALSESLLESEIFGHEEGAFTGAKKGGKMGLFELSHKGTIFLDEIGSISEGLQSRLLRVLEQKEVMRIGADRIIPIDLRIIAATNKDLVTEVNRGRMRKDLYFRLKILNIHIPPLRERREDIPFLVVTFFDLFMKKYEKSLDPLSETLLARFIDYSWPGNVREMESIIERFVLMVEGSEQYERVLDALFEECLRTEKILLYEEHADDTLPGSDLKTILSGTYHRKGEIAKRLGISRTTLWRKLKSTESNSQ